MFSAMTYGGNAHAQVSLVSSEQLLRYVTGSSKLLVPGRVSAANSIPQGAMSIPIAPSQLRGQPDIVQISVGTNPYGTIEIDQNSTSVWFKDVHWIRALRLSDDCHSYNVQLRLQPSQKVCSTLSKKMPVPKLILQCVRPVQAGQELLMWFSEDILAMLQIAFLKPANIQGQRKYVCTKCSAMYESPNPLKLHITLGCGRYAVSTLWDKLSTMLSENHKEHDTKEGFSFSLKPETQLLRQNGAMDLTTVMKQEENCTEKDLYRPYSEPSAFKPFKRISDNQENNNSARSPQMFPSVSPFMGENHNEAHMESLVSSLGKSKQGHVCLYCGKCYSRKYGLKIHIRTHTGYKPLKCKFCLRPFGDPSNLNKHVRLHAEGDTPYKCELCGKILVRRRDLDRHLKSRHLSEIHPGTSILDDNSNEDSNVSEETEKHRPESR